MNCLVWNARGLGNQRAIRDLKRLIADKTHWPFTGFYGNPILSQRKLSWQLLRRLEGIHELKNLPWLIGGDFNEILFESEKMGGQRRSIVQMTAFSNVMEDCGLHDLGCTGDPFTWCNKHKGDEMLFARLDRFVCNLDWRMKYPSAGVKNLDFWGSHHRAVL
ncbi:uncharacterized protein [Henckelia pumila]|uniref:uncharacterized protein n=1 Tax=Henckelia pumila TaxID=405737 RepID=UPI003C6DFE05